MKLVPHTARGFLYLLVHTLFCMIWGVYPGDAGRNDGNANGNGRGSNERECPKICFCNKLSKIVYCSRKGLPFIPNNIPSDTLQLNLNGNTFLTGIIQRSNFSRFLDLEHLYLSDCGIEVIEVDTFRDLQHLKWLDLSNNRIRAIQDNTFRGLTLQQLFINGNRDIALHTGSFVGLVTSGLYLHECSLKSLEVSVLAPLNNTLRYLWLNGNELERINKGFSTIFDGLSHLRLGANPLHCNCEVSWIKEFYTGRPDIFEGAVSPSCLTPPKLRGKFFNELTLTDLTCQSPVFNNIDAQLDTGNGRLKCSASGDPAPTLYWIQPTGRTTRYSPPRLDDVRKTEGILNITGSQDTIHEKSGMYICVANNEAGNVTLTVNISWPNTRATPPRVEYKSFSVTPDPAVPPAEASSPPGARPGDDGVNVAVEVEGTPEPKPAIISQHDQRRSGQGSNNNYTAFNRLNFPVQREKRLFNLTELIGAIIGTFVCTLLLCLILMPIYYRRKIRQHSTNSLEKKKPPPPEKLFLNGMGHHPMDYLDTPTTAPKR